MNRAIFKPKSFSPKSLTNERLVYHVPCIRTFALILKLLTLDAKP